MYAVYADVCLLEPPLKKGYRIGYFEIPKIKILYPQNIPLLKRIGNILFADFWI
jgi:hypothetical protein